MTNYNDRPTVDVEPDMHVRRQYNAECVDVTIPREEETESHCTVHARGNDNLDPKFGPFHEGFKFDKRTHRLRLDRKEGARAGEPPMHELEIAPKGD